MAVLTKRACVVYGWLLAGVAATAGPVPPGPAAQAPEDEIKAAYLYNFAKFVEWPGEKAGPGPIALCVAGDDALAAVVEQTVRSKTANGRTLAVRRDEQLKDPRSCHILFIGARETRRLEKILSLLDGGGVLTVGESEAFALLGGVVRFHTEQSRVRFDVNLDAAARSNVKISSKLLRVARVIYER